MLHVVDCLCRSPDLSCWMCQNRPNDALLQVGWLPTLPLLLLPAVAATAAAAALEALQCGTLSDQAACCCCSPVTGLAVAWQSCLDCNPACLPACLPACRPVRLPACLPARLPACLPALQAFPTVTHLIIRARADDTTLTMIGHNLTTLKHLELYRLAVGYSMGSLKGGCGTQWLSLWAVAPSAMHTCLYRQAGGSVGEQPGPRPGLSELCCRRLGASVLSHIGCSTALTAHTLWQRAISVLLWGLLHMH